MIDKRYIIIENILEIKQPIGYFLVGVIKANDLIKITHPNPRRYNEELEQYIGIQRELDSHKLNQLRKFITTKDASFPNSIIGTLNPNKFEYDEENRRLKIEEDSHAFAIIDGQHRLASFKEAEEIDKEFELIVTFFLGLDLEEQAYLFSVINMTQKKLNPSLVQDLTDLFTITTPEKFTHNLTKIFNNDTRSPWFEKIKMLGKSEKRYRGIISQYTFTKGILNLLADSDMSYEIRNILKTNNNDRKQLKDLKINSEKYIFWSYYVEEKDNLIYKILSSYFTSIKEIFSEQWGNPGFILTKTTGYNAFMKFLSRLHKKAKEEGRQLDDDFFTEHLRKIKGHIKKLTSDNYPPGVAGENALYKDLEESISRA